LGKGEDGDDVPALASAAEILKETGLAITTEVVRGHPAEEILRAAERQPPDLLALGSRGLGDVGRFLLGSVAERVARHAACPVLLARPPKDALDRILVGVDGSECALQAAEWILRFPLPAECEFDLVTVVTPRAQVLTLSRALLSPALLAEMSAIIRVERRQAEERLQQLVTDFAAAGKKAGPHVRPDRPALGLLATAEEREADLIVVGAHGLSVLDRFLLGSVSEQVLRHAHCSVLVVKGAEQTLRISGPQSAEAEGGARVR
jgi:nucleotide-binding universal stress UspA family protein